ncbi:MAG: GYD domain-containing protein [candidate division Zixibacteria bacterium]|nr:GYD domain-containing protein [candidate division Zixibacteria bacterium]
MATFIMAMTINPNAKKAHDDLSTRINEALEAFQKNDSKLTSLYATMGRYDCLAVFEAVDQTKAFRIASEITRSGILETETWPVISFDEFTELLS